MIQASIESFIVVNILILIVIVCPRGGRKINLMLGVEGKLAEFLQLNTHSEDASQTSIFEQLDLIRDVAFSVSIMYSLIMVVTALERYVFQGKNGNMTIKGKF